LNKCAKCGEPTTKGDLCLECIWEQEQLNDQFKFVELPKGELQGGPKPINRKNSGSQTEDKGQIARGRSPLDSDTELLIAIDELIELQKAQNILSKKTSDAAGGILAFLTLSALGAFVLWFFVAVILPNS
jgi:hypothetical protein